MFHEALCVELAPFSAFLAHLLEYEEFKNKIGREHIFYKLVLDKKVADTFPNVDIMLGMDLVSMVTSCSGEHSFSHPDLMSVECDILREINFGTFTQGFPKSRKRPGL